MRLVDARQRLSMWICTSLSCMAERKGGKVGRIGHRLAGVSIFTFFVFSDSLFLIVLFLIARLSRSWYPGPHEHGHARVAAGMLINWGAKQAKAEGVPAYLEAGVLGKPEIWL